LNDFAEESKNLYRTFKLIARMLKVFALSTKLFSDLINSFRINGSISSPIDFYP